MPNFAFPIRLFIACALLLPASLTLGADWPQWRGPNRTGYVPDGEPVPAVFPSSPKVVWHVNLGFGLDSPVVGGGHVVCLDNQNDKEIVHCFDAGNGTELWHVELDAATHDSQSAPGPRTTAVIDGDRVYAQSCRGKLKCLNSADGKLIWQKDYVKDFNSIFIGEKGKAEGASRHGYTASPLIDGDHLIAEVGGPGAGVVCFDKKSGSVIWKSQDDMPGYAPPIIGTVAGVRQFVAFTAIAAIALDPVSGNLLWRIPVKTSLGRHAVTPLLDGDFVVVSSHQAGLIGIKLAKQADSFKADIAWTQKESAINYASPVAVGGYLFGVGPHKNLICVEIATGKQTWSNDRFFTSNGGKAYAGKIVMGKNILILSDDGQLILIAANPKEYHEISRTQGCGTNWCNPAYVDGKLFLRDAHELRCLELIR